MDTEVKIGDIIIITTKDSNYLQIIPITKVTHTIDRDGCAKNRVYDYLGNEYIIRDGEFEMLEPSCVRARPDDKVIMTGRGNDCLLGRVMVVVDKNDYLVPKEISDTDQYIYCKYHYQDTMGMWIHNSMCRVLKQTKEAILELCSDCRGTQKIVLFTSTVECKTCSK